MCLIILECVFYSIVVSLDYRGWTHRDPGESQSTNREENNCKSKNLVIVLQICSQDCTNLCFINV